MDEIDVIVNGLVNNLLVKGKWKLFLFFEIVKEKLSESIKCV